MLALFGPGYFVLYGKNLGAFSLQTPGRTEAITNDVTRELISYFGWLGERFSLDVVLTGHDLGLEDRADEDERDEERAHEPELPLVVDPGADGQKNGKDGLDHGAEATPGGLDIPETKEATKNHIKDKNTAPLTKTKLGTAFSFLLSHSLSLQPY